MNPRKRLMSKRDLSILVFAFFCGILAFFTGYQRGWKDHEQTDANISNNHHAVEPLQQSFRPELPLGHPPIPQTDLHGHPTFDCKSLKAGVPQKEDELTIAQLTKNRDSSRTEVRVSAIVIEAYYGILGTNWYHLCDQPNGQVLVVSSDQLTPPKSLVNVRGTLQFDYNLSNVYRFPIYIESAILSGDQVKPALPSHPRGTIEL